MSEKERPDSAPTQPDPTEEDVPSDGDTDEVEEGSKESFPASDPPAW